MASMSEGEMVLSEEEEEDDFLCPSSCRTPRC
jgi:hypothetical protein